VWWTSILPNLGFLGLSVLELDQGTGQTHGQTLQPIFTCVSYAEARLSYTNSVCLSVRPSVTRWYCIKTAEHIVMLSSPHDSPFILVLCISRSSRNSDGVTPAGPLNRGRVRKRRNFRPITCHSETVEDRWVYIQRGVLQALNPLSNRVTFTAIVPGAYTGKAKMCKKCAKMANF